MSRKTRKLIWSAPIVAVFAVVGALAMFVMLAPENAQADGAPGPVTGLKASEVGRHHVELSWTAATGTVTGHRIDISTNGFVWMLHEDDTGSDDTLYKVEDLDAAKRYYFRVFALNGDHTGPYSIRPLNLSVMTSAAAAPDAVTGLTATKNLTKMIKLTWQQPTYNGGADVARYCILARGVQEDAAFPTATDLTTACTATIPATAAAGLGTAIGALNVDPQTAVSTIIVAAKDVEADDGSATFTLAKGEAAGSEVELGDGVTANFQVVAVNTGGRSIASNIAEGKTAAAAPATAPGAPANLKLVGVDADTNETDDVYDNSVSFYWNRPAGLGTSATVQVQRQVWASTIGWSPVTTTGGWVEVEIGDTSSDENGLVTRGTAGNYAQFVEDPNDGINVEAGMVRYRVRYTEGTLTSAWEYSQQLAFPFPQSGAADARSLPVINGDDTDTSDVTEGLQIVDNMEYFDRIDLKWDRDEYCGVSDSADDGADCDRQSQPSTYAIDVIETTNNGLPLAAEGSVADWDFLTDTISASRTTYKHRTSAMKDATMLVSDETRHYRVFPWHADRYGYPMVVTGMTKAATVPNRIAKGGLRVTANGDEKLDLSWSQASNDGGSPVTGYIIQVSTDRDNNDALDSTATWCDVKHQEISDPPVATDRMYTYDGEIHSTGAVGCSASLAAAPLNSEGEELAARYGRWFRVIPLNKKSTAPPADTIDGWTIDPDSMNAIPAFGRTGAAAENQKPGAPIGLVAETALNVHSQLTTEKGVLLTWDEPMETGTGDITDYVVQVRVDGGAWTTLADGKSDVTDWTHSNPLPKATEERVYQVAAVNIVGQGPWSNMAYYTTTSMVDPMHTHNTDPMANDMVIAPVSVMAGETTEAMDVSMYFSDADNDTLTYRAMSDMTMYATAMINGSMLTITGVAEGSATITVYASDGKGGTDAMRTISVTVTPGVLGPPTNVMTMVDDSDPNQTDVKVTWTDAPGATAHAAFLYDPTRPKGQRLAYKATNQTDGMTTFTNVEAGTYFALVVAVDADFNIEIGGSVEVVAP